MNTGNGSPCESEDVKHGNNREPLKSFAFGQRDHQ